MQEDITNNSGVPSPQEKSPKQSNPVRLGQVLSEVVETNPNTEDFYDQQIQPIKDAKLANTLQQHEYE